MHIVRWFVVLAMVISVTGNAEAGGWDKAAKAAKSAISKAAKKGASLADDMPAPRPRRPPKPETVERVKEYFSDKTCSTCNGRGWWFRCITCDGSGNVSVIQTDYYGNQAYVQQRCRSCNGKGVTPCEGCNGTGKKR